MRIYPRSELYGAFAVPPDKSITHRAIILGSMAKGKTYVIHPLICQDTQATISCVKKLGAKVSIKDGIVEIKGGRPLRGARACASMGTSSACAAQGVFATPSATAATAARLSVFSAEKSRGATSEPFCRGTDLSAPAR